MDTGETLNPLTLDLDVVPPVPWSNHPSNSRLFYFGIQMGLSIESVDLRFTHSRDRSVYGTIYINDTPSFKVHTLYHRPSSGEAETMSEPSGGPLTLCGPKYFVDAFSPTALYLHLYQVGKEDPFFKRRVPLTLGRSFPTETIVSVGEEATLTLRMTYISPSILSNVSLELSSPHSCNEWLVSGSVTAIQTINGGKAERRVNVFNRPHDRPLRTERHKDMISLDRDVVLAHDRPLRAERHKDMISLDRDVVLAPLLFDRNHILKMERLHTRYGYPATGRDPDHNDARNGVGCYLTVSVDLRLVDSGDETGKPFPVEGVCHYQFKSSHASGALFRATLRPVQVETLNPLSVSVILSPFLGTMSHMDDEPYESEIELYPPSDNASSEDEEIPIQG